MKKRHYFTKAITFDVDSLLNKSKESENNKKKSPSKSDNRAIFDIENLVEK